MTPSRHKRSMVAALLATGTTLALSGVVAPAAWAADPVTINLVTVNDFHGRIEKDGAAAGIASLSTAVNQIRTANPNTVFAAAGDLIGASTFTSFIDQDNPTIDALNAAGLDVSAAGNHEFDQGWADLRDRVQNRADWEYISSNVFVRSTGQTALAESWTTTLPNGVTTGFVGAVTEELPSLVSPAGIEDLEVRGIVTSVNAAAGRLSDGNPANGEADIVVLLVHEGAATTALASATDPSSAFGKIVLGASGDIDAIVSGHTHLAYNHVINGRPVISSGQYGEWFSNMTITYDPDDGAMTMSNALVELTTKPVPPATTRPNVYPDDPAVSPIVAAATAKANVLGAVKVGEITADFRRGLMPGVDASGNPANVESRAVESTIGNFVADVQLWAANEDGFAEIAFMNPGGLRTNLLYAQSGNEGNGVVTFREAANVQPFANALMTLTLTGAQVKQVLEEQWQPSTASRPFLKLGVNKGLTYVFDPGAPVGQHITAVYLDGVEIDPAASYRVVANSFLAAGGDNFVTLSYGTGKVDTGKVDLQSMVDWFEANGTATPDFAQRSIGVTLSAPDADGYDIGDLLTVDLTALDFTTVEPTAGDVVVSLGGIELGTDTVERVLVAAQDAVGTAQVTAPIPAGLFGTQELTVTFVKNGASFSVPVELKLETTTSARVDVPRPRAGSQTLVWVAIDAPLEVDSFRVTIDGALLGEFAYSPNGTGAVKVKLPRTLSAGTHEVLVEYLGSDQLARSSATLMLTLR